jgi:septum formation protein
MIVLASASAARAKLLRNAGVPITVDPGRIDEDAIKAAMKAEQAPPRDIADKLAELKSLRAGMRHSGQLVLGADQVLVAKGRMFDKPLDLAEARAQLEELRGQTHQLLSAAVITEDGQPVWRHIGQARLTMRPFTNQFLQEYLRAFGDMALTSVG